MSAERCPICDSSDVARHRACRDRRKGLPGLWTFWECARCGVLFQSPVPSDEELQTLYANYSSEGDLQLALSAGSRHDLLRRLYHAVTGDVDPRDFVPAGPRDRVLDYGCGVAPHLVHFRSRGVNIAGAEITPSVVDAYRAAGFEVTRIQRLDQIPYPDREFDIIYLMQVFEHIPQPHEFLREVHRILKPGGALYAAVPNGCSLWRKVFGANWVSGWFAPFHVFAYSQEPVRVLAAAHGFDVVRSWSSTPESWFRLNMKAFLYQSNDRLDGMGRTWLDVAPVRTVFIAALRLIELFARQSDCLVVQLKRASPPSTPVSRPEIP